MYVLHNKVHTGALWASRRTGIVVLGYNKRERAKNGSGAVGSLSVYVLDKSIKRRFEYEAFSGIWAGAGIGTGVVWMF